MAWLGLFAPALSADETGAGFQYIPLASYGSLSAGEQSLDSAGLGAIVMAPDLIIMAMYAWHAYREKVLLDYPAVFHTLDFLVDGKKVTIIPMFCCPCS